MGKAHQHQITQILLQLNSPEADRTRVNERLYEAVYDELRKIAGRLMRGERSDHTLQPTALVHEAYIRMVDQTCVQWQDRAHFYAIAARVMRRIRASRPSLWIGSSPSWPSWIRGWSRSSSYACLAG